MLCGVLCGTVRCVVWCILTCVVWCVVCMCVCVRALGANKELPNSSVRSQLTANARPAEVRSEDLDHAEQRHPVNKFWRPSNKQAAGRELVLNSCLQAVGDDWQ